MGNEQNSKKGENKNDKKNIDKIITNKTDKCIFKYNILFVGETGVGTKTSLIQRIKEGKFIDNMEKHKEKSEKIIYEKYGNKILLYLIDTNGEREKLKIHGNNREEEKRDFVDKYYNNADCIIMGIDLTNKQSFEEIDSYWYKRIKKKAKTKLIYLLGNKIDLKDKIEVKEKYVKKFADKNKIKYFSIYVKNDINIQNVIDDIKMNLEKINNDINNGINEIIYGNPSKEIYKVVLLGDCATGAKTSLINRISANKFDPCPNSTHAASYITKQIKFKNGKEMIVNIWDTIGQEKAIRLTQMFIQESDCVVLGYDITRRETFENIKNFWYPKSKEIICSDLIYLLANKADLYDKEEINEEITKKFAKDNNMRFFRISCLENTGINEFYNDMINELIKI